MNISKNLGNNRLTVVGGGGHIGLPLSIIFANAGIEVICYDKNKNIIEQCKKGKLHFIEENGERELNKALKSKKIKFTTRLSNKMNNSDFLITIGTPVDEFMNPATDVIYHCLDEILPYVSENRLIILRSTIFPGTTESIQKYVNKKKKKINIVFCLERVVQGKAIEEIKNLPQVIAATNNIGKKKATHIFKKITNKIIYCNPKEAEFSKLFSNAFRYIQFAIANQFFMIAEDAGEDFNKIYQIMIEGYPRAGTLPSAGFTAGPCLFKDTMQLLSFAQNNFGLGYHAMLVNEGLVLHIVNKLKNENNLSNLTIGLLGMSFKANVDDIRTSLSYKLKKQLKNCCKAVLTTDPYVKTDDSLSSLNLVLKKSDILILCAPHDDYKHLKIERNRIIDVWDFLKKK